MKNLTLTIGCILIAMNLVVGLLLSSYDSFNMWFNTVIMIVTTAMIYCINTVSLKDAVKASMTILCSISGFVKLILGAIAPEHLEDNWCVIVCVFITVFELILLLIYNKVVG